MTPYRSSRITRNIYVAIHGNIPIDTDGRTFEIHHVDGDFKNDNPSNLIALSLQDHYDIHYAQGDYNACRLIGLKLNITTSEISRLARLSAADMVARGVHNFLGGEIQSATNKRRVDDGTHHFLGGTIQKDMNATRITEGTHHFLTNHPNKVQVTCPYCNKTGGAVIFKRWHFDKCKQRS